MPAAVVKGILITVSIITALGIAIYENPEVQRWLEEQRRKVAELLRSIGEELDPQARRQAEAFAFEGRTPTNDEGLRREAESSRDATAIATGRSMSNASAIRRIPISGPVSEDEAAERRRRGREYLAKRNQQMYELQQRRNKAKEEGTATPPTPTSFDALVDDEGKLKSPEMEMLSPRPMSEALSGIPPVPEKTHDAESRLLEPFLVGEASSSTSAWQLGSRMANPFSDEYEMDRSMTPKPPVPPKVALEPEDPPTSVPNIGLPLHEVNDRLVEIERQDQERSQRPEPIPEIPVNHEELSYEEQLAIALSLSEAESSNDNSATVRQRQPEDEEDDELRAAIEASLKDMDDQQAAHAIANAEPETPRPDSRDYQPLVDLTPDPPTSVPPTSPRNNGLWGELFDQHWRLPSERAVASAPRSVAGTEDELYRVTPELTRARLASHTAGQLSTEQLPPAPNQPYDPVREAASSQSISGHVQGLDDFVAKHQAEVESSFYSAPSSVQQAPVSRTMSPAQQPHLVDVNEAPALIPQPDERTPTEVSSFGFQTDGESDSDTFASISAPASRAQSRARSELSNIEVVDLDHDSDVDMLSEEGDGVATPDSWTEVGSRDGESEISEQDERRRQRAVL